MSLFSNYNTPGNGILKAPHEKKGFFKFWEIYGRHMWKLMELNFVYFIFCIPLVATVVLTLGTKHMTWIALGIPSAIVGPATAGMTKVARNFSQERPSFVFHDFWEALKKNFKQGIAMGFIDVLFILGFIVGIPVYKQLAEQNSMMYIPFVLCLACMLTFYMMHFYIYPMICSTNLTMKQILKNSLFLVNLGIKESAWTLLSSIIVILMVYLFMPYTYFIIPFFPLTFIAFISCFNCYPVIRKHVIQPYYDQRGEENPEFAYKKVSPDEAVFEDRAAEEAPVKEKKLRRKGKTIS